MNEKPLKKHLTRSRTVGAWLLRPGLTIVLLLISITALISYVNPVLFANVASLAPGLVGAAIGMGLLSALGYLLFWGAGAALLILKTVKYYKQKDLERDEDFWPNLIEQRIKGRNAETILLLVGFVGMAIMLILTYGSSGLLAPFYDSITQSLLSGVEALAELKGLAFLTTAFSPGVIYVLVQLCFLCAPIFLVVFGGAVASWVKKNWMKDTASEDPLLEAARKEGNEADKMYAEEKGYCLLRASCDYTAESDEQLSLKQSEFFWGIDNQGAWVKVLSHDKALTGYSPLASLQVVYCPSNYGRNDSTSDIEDTDSVTDLPFSKEVYQYTAEEWDRANQTGEHLAVALFDFEGDASQYQISFAPDDHIWVISDEPQDEWLVGEKKTPKSGERTEGYFPKAYIQVLPCPSQKPQDKLFKQLKGNDGRSVNSDPNSNSNSNSNFINTQ